MSKTPVTIFLSGEFGFGPVKVEAFLLDHGRKPYAQYSDAPFVVFVPKGKRKARGWQGSFRPYCVILAGHGLEVAPASPLDRVESAIPGVECAESRYTSCDERYDTDFDSVLDRYLDKHPEKLVADYRWTKHGACKDDRWTKEV